MGQAQVGGSAGQGVRVGSRGIGRLEGWRRGGRGAEGQGRVFFTLAPRPVLSEVEGLPGSPAPLAPGGQVGQPLAFFDDVAGRYENFGGGVVDVGDADDDGERGGGGLGGGGGGGCGGEEGGGGPG